MKKALPIILLAGAAILLLSMKKKPRVTITAESPEILSESEYKTNLPEAKPSIVETGTKLISQLFTKTGQQKAAATARKIAVKRAVATKTATKKQAKAVTKSLSKGVPFIRGFADDQVMC